MFAFFFFFFLRLTMDSNTDLGFKIVHLILSDAGNLILTQ